MTSGRLLAPCYLGVLLDVLLLGLILSQFSYWKIKCESSEKLSVKVFMYWAILASFVHSGYNIAFGWVLFLTENSDGEQSLQFYQGWWIKGLCLFELALAGPVELVYARRAFVLWERPIWLKIWLFVIFTAFLTLGITIIAIASPGVALVRTTLFMVWAVTYLVLESSLTALIAVALWRKRSGLARSDRMVRRIILLSAEAQLVPLLAALVVVIWVRVMPPNSTDIFAFLGAPKIWIITCNIVILSRRGLQKHMEVERLSRQNRLNTHPELYAGGAPLAHDHKAPITLAYLRSPGFPSSPGLATGNNASDVKNPGRELPMDLEAIDLSYTLSKGHPTPATSASAFASASAAHVESGGSKGVQSAPNPSMRWGWGTSTSDVSGQADHVSSAPQLHVSYNAPPHRTQRETDRRRSSDDVGQLSFEEMLRRTSR